jgi:hypothetical protein
MPVTRRCRTGAEVARPPRLSAGLNGRRFDPVAAGAQAGAGRCRPLSRTEQSGAGEEEGGCARDLGFAPPEAARPSFRCWRCRRAHQARLPVTSQAP